MYKPQNSYVQEVDGEDLKVGDIVHYYSSFHDAGFWGIVTPPRSDDRPDDKLITFSKSPYSSPQHFTSHKNCPQGRLVRIWHGMNISGQ